MVQLLKQKKQVVNVLAVFAIATFSLHLLTLFILILQGLTVRQLSLQKPPTFVQLVNGKPVNNIDPLAREPQAIRQFVSKTMVSMFNWSGNLPPQTIEQVSKPLSDSGILIKTPSGGVKRVATSSWLASFAFAEDFRKGFLSQIAEMTPPEVFSDKTERKMSAKLEITQIYPPEKIAPDKWRVGIVANLIQTKGRDNRKLIIPFNKDVIVQAIDSFTHPLKQQITDLQQAIYSVRSDKLEIYEIRDLCLTDEYDKTAQQRWRRCKLKF
ncbi:MAG: hypothetical protein QNJ49_11865 [Mastigocoleus sp. MO_167.B18]|nr:hypothetical protein [Mastigocoleus sp. MO_167.B18]